jgi:hypothetical protein
MNLIVRDRRIADFDFLQFLGVDGAAKNEHEENTKNNLQHL